MTPLQEFEIVRGRLRERFGPWDPFQYTAHPGDGMRIVLQGRTCFAYREASAYAASLIQETVSLETAQDDARNLMLSCGVFPTAAVVKLCRYVLAGAVGKMPDRGMSMVALERMAVTLGTSHWHSAGRLYRWVQDNCS